MGPKLKRSKINSKMAFNISFPNFLCLLLTGALVVNMLTRSPVVEVEVKKDPEGVEITFCKVPASNPQEDGNVECSYTDSLLSQLGNGCLLLENLKAADLIEPPTHQSELEETDKELVEDDDYYLEVVTMEVKEEKEHEKKETEVEEKSSLVYSFVISLLLCSALVSLLEWFKEKTKVVDKKVGEDKAVTGDKEVAGSRRISLADLIVNRHIRRRDSQHNMDVMRQGATGSKPPPLIRRSSFPAQFPEVRPRQPFQRQQSHPGIPTPFVRRMSMDCIEDDSSPDRRRVRIIRRH